MTPIDSIELFDQLAEKMNGQPERYELLGDLNIDLALIMRKGDEAFRLLLGFRDISCETVTEIGPGEEANADCWVEGDLSEWQAMFDDIAANGKAGGEWTLNTLTIMGDRLQLLASDPMGWDKFHRFNQTLQDFFDAASEISEPSQETADASA